jgi:iron(III) transport system permease protein
VSRTTVDEVLVPLGPDTSSRAFNTARTNQPPWWLVLASGLTLVLVSIPLVYLAVRVSELPFQGLVEILQRPRIAQLAGNTIGLSVSVTAATLVLGTTIAALISRVRVGAPKTWLLLSALPLAVPSYLASYGWLVLSPGLNGFFPSFILLTAVTIPYVILPVAAALRGTSADAESVARTLGLSPLRAFTRVTWPQVRPAAVAGGLLVFLYTVSDFGLVAMLRFQTLTWGVQQAYAASFDRSQAAVLALLLVVIALVVVVSERKVRGQVKPTAGAHLPVESVGAPSRIFSIGLIATPLLSVWSCRLLG